MDDDIHDLEQKLLHEVLEKDRKAIISSHDLKFEKIKKFVQMIVANLVFTFFLFNRRFKEQLYENEQWKTVMYLILISQVIFYPIGLITGKYGIKFPASASVLLLISAYLCVDKTLAIETIPNHFEYILKYWDFRYEIPDLSFSIPWILFGSLSLFTILITLLTGATFLTIQYSHLELLLLNNVGSILSMILLCSTPLALRDSSGKQSVNWLCLIWLYSSAMIGVINTIVWTQTILFAVPIPVKKWKEWKFSVTNGYPFGAVGTRFSFLDTCIWIIITNLVLQNYYLKIISLTS